MLFGEMSGYDARLWGFGVTDATNSVTLAFGTDPSSGSATLTGTLTQSAVAGIATFNDLDIDEVQTGYTFSLSSTGLTGTTSASFNITQAPATQLAFITQPSTTVAGVAVSSAITVELQDSNGTVVANNTDNVTLALGTDPSSGSAIFLLANFFISF